MSSHPVSVRNKSSKFTLTKKDFYENINKIGNNAIAIKNFNIHFPSEFSQYKKTILKKNTKNKTQNSIRFNLKANNNTIEKSKKELNTLNTDFLKLFRQLDILKKTKNSNKTTIEVSLYEKKFKSIYAPSVSNSKSKGKNMKNNNNNNSKPKKKISKNKNLNINNSSCYEPLNTNEKINTYDTNQRKNFLTTNNKKKKFNVNQKNKKFPKKTFKTFNPFHIKFAKPINNPLKTKFKQSNITTYQINFSKLIPNCINSFQNNINKTQEIQNTSKTKKNRENKKKTKDNNNNITKDINNINIKITNDEKINNNNNIKVNNNNILINKNNKSNEIIKENSNSNINNEEINNIKNNINKLSQNDLESLEVNQNISNIDIFDERENYFEDDDNEESDNSGVLAYDEVRDIIVYYDMGDLNKKQGFLFEKDDYKNFINGKKNNYLNFFLNNNEQNRVLKIDNKKQTPPTNETSKTKKNFINVIKV